MRVLDSKLIGVTNMGRKKQRLRRSERRDSDSSDEGAIGFQCSHLDKSVNINQIRKSLKHSTVIGRCQNCYANSDSVQKKPAKNDSACADSSESATSLVADLPLDHEPSVLFCLQCGHQGCDRYTPDKHALQHFEKTTHSVVHNIVLNLSSYQVWCYACDNFLPVDATKKLLECVEFVYHNAGHKDSVTSYAKRTDGVKENGASHDCAVTEPRDGTTGIVKDDTSRPKVASITQASSGVLLALPKVKGLNNLGNTCFFNAVVQNLGQTLLLESLLRDLCHKGQTLDLCAFPQASDDSDDDDSDDKDCNEQKQKLQKPESISLTLGECGSLTQSVVNLFDEMKSLNKQNSISPSALFGQVCKKAPRFKGFQQQDSHELLRYLLDAIRGEEIKRAQVMILKAFKLPDNPKPSSVPEEIRCKVKALGREAKHTFVDSVFGGHFISTVVCQACDTHHQIFEPFLDMSLPVVEEKSFKSSASQSCKSKDGGQSVNADNADSVDDTGAKSGPVRQSKHLSKKEKKMAKKAAKGRKGGANQRQLHGGQKQPSAVVDSPLSEEKGAEEDQAKATCQEDGAVTTEEVNGRSDQEMQNDEDKDDDDDDEETCDDEKSEDLKCDAEEETQKGEGDHRVENGMPKKSRGESESSDADVEDNEEGDASRYRGMTDSTDVLPVQNFKQDDAIHDEDGNHAQQKEGIMDENVTDLQPTSCAEPPSQPNGKIVADVADGVDSLHLQDGMSQNDPAADGEESSSVKQPAAGTLENGFSRTELCKKARKTAMKTLMPREKPVGQECSVLSSLYQFTSHELLSGNNMYRCSVCNKADKNVRGGQGQKQPVLTCASKQFLIYSPPAILTLHLKRFQQVGFNLRKITRHIEFSELLDLAPFCSALCQNIRIGQRRILYSLYGIVEHSGTLRSGHYTAYVKVRHSNPSSKQFLQTMTSGQLTVQRLVDMMKAIADAKDTAEIDVDSNAKQPVVPPGKWYYISDSNVSEVRNVSNVLNCQAYLLFYERIE